MSYLCWNATVGLHDHIRRYQGWVKHILSPGTILKLEITIDQQLLPYGLFGGEM